MQTRRYGALFAMTALTIMTMAMAPVRAQLFSVSEKDELQAGRDADAQIRQKYRISSDRYYNGLVTHLGRRLVQVCERPNIPWTFRVIDSKDINAFSVPGYVYVNTGLIEMAGDDQDALAGVIAHEIGHTCGRHAVKQMQESSIGSLLAGLLGGRNKTTQALAGVATNLVLLGHSRGEEYDADKRGIRYALRAGYDPDGLIRFFEKLQEKVGNGGGGLATYFQTHPVTSDRIKRAQDEIRKQEASR